MPQSLGPDQSAKCAKTRGVDCIFEIRRDRKKPMLVRNRPTMRLPLTTRTRQTSKGLLDRIETKDRVIASLVNSSRAKISVTLIPRTTPLVHPRLPCHRSALETSSRAVLATSTAAQWRRPCGHSERAIQREGAFESLSITESHPLGLLAHSSPPRITCSLCGGGWLANPLRPRSC